MSLLVPLQYRFPSPVSPPPPPPAAITTPKPCFQGKLGQPEESFGKWLSVFFLSSLSQQLGICLLGRDLRLCLLVSSLCLALEQWKRRLRCCSGFRAIWRRLSPAEVVASGGGAGWRCLSPFTRVLWGALRQDRRLPCIPAAFLLFGGTRFLPRWVGGSFPSSPPPTPESPPWPAAAFRSGFLGFPFQCQWGKGGGQIIFCHRKVVALGLGCFFTPIPMCACMDLLVLRA